MQSALKRVTVVAAACLAGGLGVAFAQDSVANPVPEGASLDAAQIEALTPQQMLEQAQSDLRAMERGASVVWVSLKHSRRTRPPRDWKKYWSSLVMGFSRSSLSARSARAATMA